MEVPKRPKPFSMLDKVLDWINVFSLLSVAVLIKKWLFAVSAGRVYP